MSVETAGDLLLKAREFLQGESSVDGFSGQRDDVAGEVLMAQFVGDIELCGTRCAQKVEPASGKIV
jgi:hypothetical protein